ncbi:MAG: metal ABC transporter permease [Chloroflexota bacterium]
MDILSLFNDLLFNYTLRSVALGTAVIGAISGVLGCFALLRKQSLLGDAISHAALPGVVLAFIITRSRSSIILMIGAALAGWLATLLIQTVVSNTRIKEDSALGLALSVFFGFGLMLLSFTQRMTTARQAGLDRFLFGQAAAIIERDVIVMTIIGTLALLAVALYWKEFKLISFDPAYAASIGYPVRSLSIGLTTLMVIAIVIGLQTVGVILMSAMLVAPAAAARQWTDKLSVMVVIAAAFGAMSGVGGAIVSATSTGLSTGPVIVLIISTITILSMLLAPNRGLVWRWFQRQRNQQRLQLEMVLADLHSLAQQHRDNPAYGHDVAVLKTMNHFQGGVAYTLKALEAQALAQQVHPGKWALTAKGWEEAERLQQIRWRESDSDDPTSVDIHSETKTELIRAGGVA